MAEYRTAPRPTKDMPPGVPYIVGNEAAERFSYYGMRAILTIFMTKYLVDSTGALDVMSDAEASYWFHIFGMAVYGFPLLGALLSDAVLGKYRTILWLSIVYCFGHLALAVDETRLGLAVGLTLIAIGSGGIKPCVSAHVGDQFGDSNRHLLERVFQWFYFSINLGSAAATLLIPVLLDEFGPHVAFGVPGILMAVATVVFWIGRKKFVHVPPGGRAFLREAFSREGLGAMGKLVIIYAFISMFWALFDQTGSRWVLQADEMDLEVAFGITLLPSQLQAANPILVMLLIPFASLVIYPTFQRFFEPTPLRRIGIGLFIAAIAFLVPAWIEWRIGLDETPTIMWQVLAYVLITLAEVMVSITALEFSYTQAPNTMKSLIMALYLMSISIGNAFVAAVNYAIDELGVVLDGPDYYLFFAGCMAIAATIYIPVARWFPVKTYIQAEAVEDDAG